MAEPEEQSTMGLFDHLRELRNRIFISFVAVLVAAIVSFEFTDHIQRILSAPHLAAFSGHSLIGTGPAEAFILRIKLAFFGGVLLACPILFYQLWLFIAPGLYQHERRMILPFVFSASSLFLVGIWFCYTWVLPLAFTFFSSQYQVIGVSPMIKISEHLSFMIHALLGFGIVFELPVVAFLLGRFGLIDHRTLIDGGRYAIVAIFVISAIFTPPDVLSQLLMAGPLLVLYGISIVIVRYTHKGRIMPDSSAKIA